MHTLIYNISLEALSKTIVYNYYRQGIPTTHGTRGKIYVHVPHGILCPCAQWIKQPATQSHNCMTTKRHVSWETNGNHVHMQLFHLHHMLLYTLVPFHLASALHCTCMYIVMLKFPDCATRRRERGCSPLRVAWSCVMRCVHVACYMLHEHGPNGTNNSWINQQTVRDKNTKAIGIPLWELGMGFKDLFWHINSHQTMWNRYPPRHEHKITHISSHMYMYIYTHKAKKCYYGIISTWCIEQRWIICHMLHVIYV